MIPVAQLTPAESFVRRKLADDERDVEQFESRLKKLKALQVKARLDATVALTAFLKVTVEYAKLYATVERDGERVARLNSALALNETTASKWRQIAAMAASIARFQKHVPAGTDPLYEVTLALKGDEELVRKAISEKRLTPQSTAQEVRALRKSVRNAPDLADTETASSPSGISGLSLRKLQCRVVFEPDSVPRVEELAALQQTVHATLQEAFGHLLKSVEFGISEGGAWRAGWELERRLKTYWDGCDGAGQDRRDADGAA